MLKGSFQKKALRKGILTGHLQHVWFHSLDPAKEQKLHLLSQSS